MRRQVLYTGCKKIALRDSEIVEVLKLDKFQGHKTTTTFEYSIIK